MLEVEIIRLGSREVKEKGRNQRCPPGTCLEQVGGDIYKDGEAWERKRFWRDEGGGHQKFTLKHRN